MEGMEGMEGVQQFFSFSFSFCLVMISPVLHVNVLKAAAWRDGPLQRLALLNSSP